MFYVDLHKNLFIKRNLKYFFSSLESKHTKLWILSKKIVFNIKKARKRINNLQQIVSQNPTRKMECDRKIHSDRRRRRRKRKKSEENYLCQYLCSRITLTRCWLSRHSVAKTFYHSKGERQFYFIYLPSFFRKLFSFPLLHGHKYGMFLKEQHEKEKCCEAIFAALKDTQGKKSRKWA